MGIYEEIGVTPFINAVGNMTRFGGSIMSDCVVQAMVEASKSYVNLYDLQKNIGEKIAVMTNNEAAYVSCGAASGISLTIASCMTGTDSKICERLPDTQGMKNKVIMHKCGRFWEDISVQVPGVIIVEIGNAQGASERDLIEAIDEETVAVFTCGPEWDGMIPIPKIVELSHAAKVPVIVDAAFGVPPRENFWKFTRDYKVDAVIISGGKGLRGPQSTGLVLGKREIIEGCIINGNPNRGIGRTMKVGKEEMVGIYAAVKYFMEHNEIKTKAEFEKVADRLIILLEKIPGIKIEQKIPRVIVRINGDKINLSDKKIQEELLNGNPSIWAYCIKRTLSINISTLQPGEEEVVANRLKDILT